MQQLQARRTQVIALAPELDPQWVNAITAADALWGPAERWREVVDRHRATVSTDPAQLAEPAGLQDVTARRRRVFERPGSRSKQRDVVTDPLPAPDIAAEETFDVPRPGRSRTSTGRVRSWTVRLALATAPLVLIGGVAYAAGVGTGSARITSPGTITTTEAARYHLTSFPAETAAAYGETYLTLCLTHPDPQNKTATTDRLAGLARMVSAGVSPGCGWDGTGPAQQPLAVSWDGSTTATAATYLSGQAAQLRFLITYAGGRTGGVSVPIWVDDTATGMRVVGDLAVMPANPPAAAPTVKVRGDVDGELSQTLPGQVLLPFLKSWAASDTVQLNLVLTNDATVAARTGLDGQVETPTINRTQVLTDQAITSGQTRAYIDGDAVTALVSIDWSTSPSATQRAAYVITLHRSASRWQIYDIAGAAPDPAGGAASGTTFATDTTTP